MIVSSFLPDLHIPEISIGQYVMSALDKFGDRIAMIEMHTDRKVTFAQLKEKVLLYTKILWKAGLRKGDVVGLVLPIELDYLPLLIAIVNCGAVIFGCKLLYRWSIYKQLNNIKPRLVIVTDERFEAVSTDIVDKIPDIELCCSFSQLYSLEENSIRLVEDLPCYDCLDVHADPVVIYQSSGTTGEPKGMLLTHYNFMATIEIGRATYQLLPGSIMAVALSIISSLGFDFLFQNLISGSITAFAPIITHELFFEYVSKYRINSVWLFDRPCLLDIANLEIPKEADIRSLNNFFVGGCMFSQEMLQNIGQKLNGILVASEYGMAECSWITMPAYTSVTPTNSVGYLCPNMKLKVISLADHRECGSNEKGELYVKGPCLMKGYFSRDKPDTFGLIDGWLPTGDLGYFDEDNCIHICGRINDMIKMPPSYTPVLPIEFEEILLKHKQIKDVSVLAVPHPLLDKVAKAFVVRSDDKLSQDEVIQFFSSQVDSVLSLDGGIEFVDIIPRNDLGKPIRRELLKQNLSSNE